MYYYGTWRPKFDVMQKHSIQFFQGVPDKDNITEWFGDTQGRI